MALIYKAIQSQLPTKEGKKLYYPRLIKMGRVVDTQKLGELIAEKASLTPGDVHNVIRNLMSVMRQQLLNSRSVRLNGLGTFTMIAHSGGNGVEKEEEVTSTQIKRLQCRFTAEYTRPAGSNATRALLDGVEYVNLSNLTKGTAQTNSSNNGNDDEGDFTDPTT
ncbi:DNA-binding protein [Bacteroides sp. 214]|uniref:HU family DNA-binding protein n=1 Tax=Bacteroides sp. 214 TaxID=2302935 RepID=UPI0013D69179|nr:HU family DNA-binding protein [Bacteroides sp. 214]NDW13196.1 DNA-binding protein [Bacteroides sp. 214]